jgi:HTH-type transcriptional regulator, sugar sensing transcriptional regulator
VPTANPAAVAALRQLGLNQLEAEVYAFLLANEPLTAYAVGRALGKATANVYKAVESLARMGAVLVEEGDKRVCRAVPPREYLRHSERTFLAKTKTAAEVLSDLESDFYDERVYRIEGVAEALERCVAMLGRARRLAVVDAFPLSLQRITPAIVKATRRGVEVRVEAYQPVEIEGAAIVVAHTGQRSIDHWGAEQLNVVVDGKEVLLALMSLDLSAVYQALWSRSLYLSCLIHSGLMSEQTIHKLHLAFPEGRKGGDPRRVLAQHRFFVDGDVPGQRELRERFVGGKSRNAPHQTDGGKK